MLVCEPRISVRHEHRAGVSELEEQVESWSRGFACAVERSKLAFPEERVPYTVLMARIALLYHARRATIQPAIRRLALAELRGMYRRDESLCRLPTRCRGDGQVGAKPRPATHHRTHRGDTTESHASRTSRVTSGPG